MATNNNKLAEATQKVIDTLNYYIWFPEKNQDVLCGMWIVGTYFHTDYAHYGLLWSTAEDMRMGKSIVLKIAANTGFNSEGYVRFGTSVSGLFRSCVATTIAIDEYENIPKQLKSELDTILRGSYEAGGVYTKNVEVVSKVKGKGTVKEWVPQHYPIYGPKIIGSIREQPGTIQDRCFIINMVRKETTEDKPVLNLNDNSIKAMFQAQRIELVEAAKLTRDQVLAEYRPMLASRPPELHFMDDRLKDVSLGLLAVAKVAGCEKQLIEALKDQVELRDGTTNENAELLADLLETIDAFLLLESNNGKKVRSRKLSQYAPEKSSLRDPQQLGFLLGKLKCKRVTPHNVPHFEITSQFREQVAAKIS